MDRSILTLRTILLRLLFGLMVEVTVVCAADPTISVSIAVPPRDDGVRYLEDRGPESHFHVVVTNLSNKPQRVWSTSFSKGYSALSFEMTDKNGTKWIAKRRERDWPRNIPSWWSLPPGEHLVIEVYFCDLDRWVRFPDPRGNGPQTISMSAVLEIDAQPISEKHGIWTGRVVSETHQYSCTTVGKR
jgi:hypothetical protein